MDIFRVVQYFSEARKIIIKISSSLFSQKVAESYKNEEVFTKGYIDISQYLPNT